MKRIIKRGDFEFLSAPKKGWNGNEFFLLSAGKDLIRVWTRDDPDLPRFATGDGRASISNENAAILAWCNAKSVAAALDAAQRIMEVIGENSINWKYREKAKGYLARMEGCKDEPAG